MSRYKYKVYKQSSIARTHSWEMTYTWVNDSLQPDTDALKEERRSIVCTNIYRTNRREGGWWWSRHGVVGPVLILIKFELEVHTREIVGTHVVLSSAMHGCLAAGLPGKHRFGWGDFLPASLGGNCKRKLNVRTSWEKEKKKKKNDFENSWN